jgi:hypothetical protein
MDHRFSPRHLTRDPSRKIDLAAAIDAMFATPHRERAAIMICWMTVPGKHYAGFASLKYASDYHIG